MEENGWNNNNVHIKISVMKLIILLYVSLRLVNSESNNYSLMRGFVYQVKENYIKL